MHASLPSLPPRDSHALWYIASHAPNIVAHLEQTTSQDHATLSNLSQNAAAHQHRRLHQTGAHRTPLARLRADEVYLERRKQNVQNYGASWIKPPGVHKTLHQQREEDREQKEHQEALRREQLAMELAEAEARDEMLPIEGGAGDLEEARDLDDDIPEGNITELLADESDNASDENPADRIQPSAPAPYQTFTEVVAGVPRFVGLQDEYDSDEDNMSQLLQAEDFRHDVEASGEDQLGMNNDMDMDADLDDDVIEAGLYEHTDTEEELDSSEDEESVDRVQLPQGYRTFNATTIGSDGTQSNMGLNSTNLQSDLSRMRSSPGMGRAGSRS